MRERTTASPARWGTASLFAIPLFLVVALVVSALWRPPVWLAGLYLGASVLAQQWLRHKSVKAEFRATFWFTVLVNVSAFVVLCSPQGQVLWRV